jgi:hypothetical protein
LGKDKLAMTLLFLFLFVGSLDQDLMDGSKQSLGEKAGTTKHAGKKKRDGSHLRRERKSA